MLVKLMTFFFFSSSPDIALPSVSAYDNEDSMLNFVKTQLQEIAKQKGNYDDMLLLILIFLVLDQHTIPILC